MKVLYYIALLPLVLLACDIRYGQYEIERPVIDGSVNAAMMQTINEELMQRPDDGTLLKRKVRFLESANWPDDSRQTLDKAITLSPEDGELRYVKGRFFLETEMLDSALYNLERAGKLGYLTAEYFSVYAQALLSKGEIDSALQEVARFKLLDPENYRSEMILGEILFEKLDTLGARGAFERAFVLENGDEELNLLLMDLLLNIGDSAGFSTIQAQVDQSDDRWVLKQAMLKYSHGLLEETNEDLKAILARNNDFMPAMLYLGRTYYEMDLYDSSLYYSDLAIARDSLSLPARLFKARSFDKKFFYNQSIEEYQALLAIDSTFNNAAEELNAVYRKVAYLRRLKEEKESIPEIDLAPIRRKN